MSLCRESYEERQKALINYDKYHDLANLIKNKATSKDLKRLHDKMTKIGNIQDLRVIFDKLMPSGFKSYLSNDDQRRLEFLEDTLTMANNDFNRFSTAYQSVMGMVSRSTGEERNTLKTQAVRINKSIEKLKTRIALIENNISELEAKMENPDENKVFEAIAGIMNVAIGNTGYVVNGPRPSIDNFLKNRVINKEHVALYERVIDNIIGTARETQGFNDGSFMSWLHGNLPLMEKALMWVKGEFSPKEFYYKYGWSRFEFFSEFVQKIKQITSDTNTLTNEKQFEVDSMISGIFQRMYGGDLNYNVSRTGTVQQGFSVKDDGNRLIEDMTKIDENTFIKEMLIQKMIEEDLEESVIKKITDDIAFIDAENELLMSKKYGRRSVSISEVRALFGRIKDLVQSEYNPDARPEAETAEGSAIAFGVRETRKYFRGFMGYEYTDEEGNKRIKEGIINKKYAYRIDKNSQVKMLTPAQWKAYKRLESRRRTMLSNGDTPVIRWISPEDRLNLSREVERIEIHYKDYWDLLRRSREEKDVERAKDLSKQASVLKAKMTKAKDEVTKRYNVTRVLDSQTIDTVINSMEFYQNDFYFPKIRKDLSVIFAQKQKDIKEAEAGGLIDADDLIPEWAVGYSKAREWRRPQTHDNLAMVMKNYGVEVVRWSKSIESLHTHSKFFETMADFNQATGFKNNEYVDRIIRRYATAYHVTWDKESHEAIFDQKRLWDEGITRRFSRKLFGEKAGESLNAILDVLTATSGVSFSFVLNNMASSAVQNFGIRLAASTKLASEFRYPGIAGFVVNPLRALAGFGWSKGSLWNKVSEDRSDTERIEFIRKTFGLDIPEFGWDLDEYIAAKTNTHLGDVYKEMNVFNFNEFENVQMKYSGETDKELRAFADAYMNNVNKFNSEVSSGAAGFMTLWARFMHNIGLLHKDQLPVFMKEFVEERLKYGIAGQHRVRRVGAMIHSGLTFSGGILSARRFMAAQAFYSHFDALYKNYIKELNHNLGRDASNEVSQSAKALIAKQALEKAKKLLEDVDGVMNFDNKPEFFKKHPWFGALKMWALNMSFYRANELILALKMGGTKEGAALRAFLGMTFFFSTWHWFVNMALDDDDEVQNWLATFLWTGFIGSGVEVAESIFHKEELKDVERPLRLFSPWVVNQMLKMNKLMSGDVQDPVDYSLRYFYKNDILSTVAASIKYLDTKKEYGDDLVLLRYMVENMMYWEHRPGSVRKAIRMKNMIHNRELRKIRDINTRNEILDDISLREDDLFNDLIN